MLVLAWIALMMEMLVNLDAFLWGPQGFQFGGG